MDKSDCIRRWVRTSTVLSGPNRKSPLGSLLPYGQGTNRQDCNERVNYSKDGRKQRPTIVAKAVAVQACDLSPALTTNPNNIENYHRIATADSRMSMCADILSSCRWTSSAPRLETTAARVHAKHLPRLYLLGCIQQSSVAKCSRPFQY